jgi:Protein kinase domain
LAAWLNPLPVCASTPSFLLCLIYTPTTSFTEVRLPSLVFSLSVGVQLPCFVDLKPENILLSGESSELRAPRLKLADFGLAKVLGHRAMASTVCGTPMYVAPEVLIQGICPTGGYRSSVDMWSAGVILYEL